MNELDQKEKRIELLERTLDIISLVVIGGLGSRVITVDEKEIYNVQFDKKRFDSMMVDVFGKEHFDVPTDVVTQIPSQWNDPLEWMKYVIDKEKQSKIDKSDIDTEIPSHYCLCCGMPPHNCLASHED